MYDAAWVSGPGRGRLSALAVFDDGSVRGLELHLSNFASTNKFVFVSLLSGKWRGRGGGKRRQKPSPRLPCPALQRRGAPTSSRAAACTPQRPRIPLVRRLPAPTVDRPPPKTPTTHCTGVDPACQWSVRYSPGMGMAAVAGEDGLVALAYPEVEADSRLRRPHVPLGGIVRCGPAGGRAAQRRNVRTPLLH